MHSEAVRLAILALSKRLLVGTAERAVVALVPRDVVEMRNSLDRMVAEVRRVSVNVNQIVRMWHVKGWTENDLPGLSTVLQVIAGLVYHFKEMVDHVGQ
ncbi:hypothetical protein [Corynebacterium sp. ES2715-CONJ3]|uniref:hypothetical protein n=1 Tax=Corynebacterium sp. ES2715-CONJ3 TaxID=2974028 RepID=UPI00216A03BC|nr:hypothetical protein [Corynebacterium sp. ES2715-CONJ3]MCS4491548.1 hypothetical protein [Corynebacterium sp. ES2715-CONJ3]